MTDYIIRATGSNGMIRAFVATTQNLVNEAAGIHKTSAVASAALGRTLTAASIMGLNSLGNDGSILTISIKGDGPLGGVLAVADGTGQVRGYVHNTIVDVPDRADGKLNVGAAVGQGQMTIAMDLGLKGTYTGTTELVSGEIAEDIAHYYMTSEQTPSIVSLGVLVDCDLSIKSAGGFFLQLMPGYDDALIDKLEAHMANFPAISKLLEQEKTPEDILEMLLSGFGYEVTGKHEVGFKCNCSADRVKRALMTIGHEEIQKIIDEIGKAEMNCHFCNKQYLFEKNELESLL